MAVTWEQFPARYIISLFTVQFNLYFYLGSIDRINRSYLEILQALEGVFYCHRNKYSAVFGNTNFGFTVYTWQKVSYWLLSVTKWVDSMPKSTVGSVWDWQCVLSPQVVICRIKLVLLCIMWQSLLSFGEGLLHGVWLLGRAWVTWPLSRAWSHDCSVEPGHIM